MLTPIDDPNVFCKHISIAFPKKVSAKLKTDLEVVMSQS